MAKPMEKESAEIIDFNEYMERIDEEAVEEFCEKSHSEAEELLKDENKMERFLQKLEKKLKLVPVAGDVLAYIPVMISLVRSYIKKEYTEIPVASIISILVALIYFLSPIDLIPDAIPGAGYIDDAVVISGCLALILSDLEEYQYWRKENGYEIADLPEYTEPKDYGKFVNAFFKGRKSIKNKEN